MLDKNFLTTVFFFSAFCIWYLGQGFPVAIISCGAGPGTIQFRVAGDGQAWKQRCQNGQCLPQRNDAFIVVIYALLQGKAILLSRAFNESQLAF